MLDYDTKKAIADNGAAKFVWPGKCCYADNGACSLARNAGKNIMCLGTLDEQRLHCKYKKFVPIHENEVAVCKNANEFLAIALDVVCDRHIIGDEPDEGPYCDGCWIGNALDITTSAIKKDARESLKRFVKEGGHMPFSWYVLDDPIKNTEVNTWCEFYWVFKDNNALNLHNAAHNKGILDMSDEALHEENVKWAMEVLEHDPDVLIAGWWIGKENLTVFLPYFMEAKRRTN